MKSSAHIDKGANTISMIAGVILPIVFRILSFMVQSYNNCLNLVLFFFSLKK